MPKMSYIIIAFMLVLVSLSAVIGRFLFADVEIIPESREFVVEKGQSVKQISKSLEENNIILSDFWFRTLVWLKSSQSNFMAGTFELPEKISSFELIDLLTTKAKRETRKIKILEGWGIDNIDKYLSEEGILKRGDFKKVTGPQARFNFFDIEFYNKLALKYPLLKYKLAGAPLEGYLFPDTYEIYSDASAEDIVRKMVANFANKISQDLRDEVFKQGKNFYKVLILASIIEAEVPLDEDRAIVSDIFWSRLENDVPLQSCATLNYRIGGDKPALTAEQLKIDSVYNTYLYKNLPPTPIGNPGLSSIRAAIYPADTDYFYFLSTPEGKTIFSRSLNEHNKAKKKYLNN